MQNCIQYSYLDVNSFVDESIGEAQCWFWRNEAGVLLEIVCVCVCGGGVMGVNLCPWEAISMSISVETCRPVIGCRFRDSLFPFDFLTPIRFSSYWLNTTCPIETSDVLNITSDILCWGRPNESVQVRGPANISYHFSVTVLVVPKQPQSWMTTL
jgi:hypothetical protein